MTSILRSAMRTGRRWIREPRAEPPEGVWAIIAWAERDDPKRSLATRPAGKRRGKRFHGGYREQVLRDPCSYCSRPPVWGASNWPTVDHIFPVALGGTSHWINLAAACHACNKLKRCLSPMEFLLRERHLLERRRVAHDR